MSGRWSKVASLLRAPRLVEHDFGISEFRVSAWRCCLILLKCCSSSKSWDSFRSTYKAPGSCFGDFIGILSLQYSVGLSESWGMMLGVSAKLYCDVYPMVPRLLSIQTWYQTGAIVSWLVTARCLSYDTFLENVTAFFLILQYNWVTCTTAFASVLQPLHLGVFT